MVKEANRVRDDARTELNKMEEAWGEERRQKQRLLIDKRRKLQQKVHAAAEHEAWSNQRREALLAETDLA